jgi:hypothetical protein
MLGQEKTGDELFIVENSDEAWKGPNYLQDWTEIVSAFDIATGCFEFGSMLALDRPWQKLDKIPLFLSDEMIPHIQQALLAGLGQSTNAVLEAGIESEKDKNDLLMGLPAIVEGTLSARIVQRSQRPKSLAEDRTHSQKSSSHSPKLSAFWPRPKLAAVCHLNDRIMKELNADPHV